MPFSFHTHSGEFCNHASGNLEEVILRAIELKFDTIGLTEHVPRFKQEFLYPEESELKPTDLATKFEAYYKKANELKLKYKEKIKILIGAELEYINEDHCNQLHFYLSKFNFDYLMGSLHHVNNIPIDFDQQTFSLALQSYNNDMEALSLQYFEDQYNLIKKFHPRVIGHFDLIRLFAPKDYQLSSAVKEKIYRNIRYIVEYGGLFEINTRSLKKSLPYPYPQPDILKIIIELGGKVTLSDDSHGAKDVGMHYNKVMDYLTLMGIDKIYYLVNSENQVKVEEFKSFESWFNNEFK